MKTKCQCFSFKLPLVLPLGIFLVVSSWGSEIMCYIKKAVISIFMIKVDQMTVCNMKGVAHSDISTESSPNSAVSLNFSGHFSSVVVKTELKKEIWCTVCSNNKCLIQHKASTINKNVQVLLPSLFVCYGLTCFLLSCPSLHCSTRKMPSKYHFPVPLNCHFNPLSHCSRTLSSSFVSSFSLGLLFVFLLPLSLQPFST